MTKLADGYTTLTEWERANYELLGRAKVIIEELLDEPSKASKEYAKEWLVQYDKLACLEEVPEEEVTSEQA